MRGADCTVAKHLPQGIFDRLPGFRTTIGVMRPEKRMQLEITKLLLNHHKVALKKVCCDAELRPV